MKEVRGCPVDGRRVIIASDRRQRPNVRPPLRARAAAEPRLDEACPFCPGNEAMLPDIVSQASASASGSWQTRIVLNKYPAVCLDARTPQRAPAGYGVAPATGRHEVIIEHPHHDWDFCHASVSEVVLVLSTYAARYRVFAESGHYGSVLLFRNRGEAAGASLRHPHAQLIALQEVTRELLRRRALGEAYYERAAGCPMCVVVSAERADGRRIVLENEGFVAFVPYAAEVPFEMWIVPRGHSPQFDVLPGDEATLLAATLRDAAAWLEDCRQRDISIVLHADPRGDNAPLWSHWYLQLRPRHLVTGGFEMGSGLAINPMPPEESAAALRQARALDNAGAGPAHRVDPAPRPG